MMDDVIARLDAMETRLDSIATTMEHVLAKQTQLEVSNAKNTSKDVRPKNSGSKTNNSRHDSSSHRDSNSESDSNFDHSLHGTRTCYTRAQTMELPGIQQFEFGDPNVDWSSWVQQFMDVIEGNFETITTKELHRTCLRLIPA